VNVAVRDVFVWRTSSAMARSSPSIVIFELSVSILNKKKFSAYKMLIGNLILFDDGPSTIEIKCHQAVNKKGKER
jgi:hypothetical protein